MSFCLRYKYNKYFFHRLINGSEQAQWKTVSTNTFCMCLQNIFFTLYFDQMDQDQQFKLKLNDSLAFIII